MFHDIADSYPNDADIIISFTLTTNVPVKDKVPSAAADETSTPAASLVTAYGRKISGDRVGLFKVPYVSPHEVLTFQWVIESDTTNEGGIQDVGTVIFKGKIFKYWLSMKVPHLKHLIRGSRHNMKY